MGLALYATCVPHAGKRGKWARTLIVGGGVVFPTVVLTFVLVYSLVLLPEEHIK